MRLVTQSWKRAKNFWPKINIHSSSSSSPSSSTSSIETLYHPSSFICTKVGCHFLRTERVSDEVPFPSLTTPAQFCYSEALLLAQTIPIHITHRQHTVP